MKAIMMSQPGNADVLKLSQIAPTTLKKDEVRVRLSYAGINHVDLWVRQGSPAYPAPMPHILGVDGAGHVEEVGPEAEGISVGDAVVIVPGIACGMCSYCQSGKTNQCDQFEIIGTKRWGTYAEQINVPDRNVVILPTGFPLDKAAAFPVATLTAYHMLMGRAQLQKGETLLVVGASAGIAIAAIQLAKRQGAKVFAATSSSEKIDLIKEYGADDVFVLGPSANLSQWVKQKTEMRGVDVVFEHVGPVTWNESLAACRKYGRLVTCGATTGPTVSLELRQIFSKDISILGARLGTEQEFHEVCKLVFSGEIEPAISNVFDLEQAAEAHKILEQKKQIGKILLKI